MPRRTTLSSRALTFGLAAVAAAAVLSGCTAAAHPVASPTPSSAPASAIVPSDIANDASRRADVTLTACAPIGGGRWQASGVITNPLAIAHDYTVTVFFTNRVSTVIGFASVSVNVAAGVKRKWQASGTAPSAAPTLCVLRGVD